MTKKKTSKIEQVNRAVSDKVNQKQDGWPVRALGAISDIGDQPQMRPLCAGTFALGLIGRDFRLAASGVKMLAALTVATWEKSGIKAVIDRTRPDSRDDPAVRFGDSDAHEHTSFPSGHSAGAVAGARAFARDYPDHAFVANTAAFAVSAVQVTRGTHYVGDVFVGVLIGLAGERASEVILAVSTLFLTNIIERRKLACN